VDEGVDLVPAAPSLPSTESQSTQIFRLESERQNPETEEASQEAAEADHEPAEADHIAEEALPITEEAENRGEEALKAPPLQERAKNAFDVMKKAKSVKPTGKKANVATKARAKKLTKKAPKNDKLEQSSILVDKVRIFQILFPWVI